MVRLALGSMAGRIPREFIDELIDRVDLVDLIGARVPLRKAGINYQARCPFHSEKTPSFNVSREKQFYHCFGCGAHGNAISFLMDYERQTFVEAVETLAESLGLEIPREVDGGERREREASVLPLYQVQEQAAQFYERQLREHPKAARARDYLKRRGLSEEVIRRFQVGYAPPGWRNLPASLPADSLLSAGLAIAREGGNFYDRFRDRVMFPIRDRRGRVVGFGGRVLGEDTPKYLNSPETAVFKKHREVYGLHELLVARQKPERIVVVEGYMDVIALAQYEILYAVATLGTATSSDHVGLLFRYARELVFCFDGDNAGRSAARKAMEASLPVLRDGRSIRFLMLPEGYDPDSLVREEGKEGFERRLSMAQPLSDFFFQQLSEGLDIGSVEGRVGLLQNANPLLGKLPEGVFRDMMRSRLDELAGQGKSIAPTGAARTMRLAPKPSTRRGAPSILRTVLMRLIQKPALFALLDGETRACLEQEARAGELFRKLFAILDEKPNITLGGIEERFRGEAESALIKKLSVGEKLLSEAQEQDEFPDALRRYMAKHRQQRLECLLRKGLGELNQAEREELRRLSSKK